MNVHEFCIQYMDGKEPTKLQRKAISHFLDAEAAGDDLWMLGRGAGKTTVREAQIRYINDQEGKTHGDR